MGALARKIEQEGVVKGIAKGIAKGIVKGIAKGEVKRSQEIAIAMLKKGLDIDLIMEVTNLTKEEINKLKEKIK